MWVTSDNPEPGKLFSLVVGYGHSYPTWEPIPDEEYPLFKTKLIGPKGEIALTPGSPNYLWSSQAPVDGGNYVAIVEVDPIFWTRTADGWSMKPKNETPGATSCGRYIEGGKGIITVGTGGDTKVITKPVGLPLEIVPSVNPSTVKPGGKLPLTVLFNGKPLPAAKVNARYAGFDKLAESTSAQAFSSVTDKDGKLTFVPLVAGEWIVTVSNEIPYSDLTACDKEAYGTSLHFDIKENLTFLFSASFIPWENHSPMV
jgi:uncharacterized GH25 family protein